MSSLSVRYAIRLAMGMAVCITATAVSGADEDLAEARSKIDRARQQLNGASAARARGDAEAARRYEEEAARLYKEATATYKTALAEDPDNVKASCGYATLLNQRGDSDLAVDVMLRAVRRAPKSAVAWLTLGQAYSAWGPKHAGDADKALRRAVALEPETAVGRSALATLGAQYWEEGLYDFSRDAFERLLQLDPANVAAKIGVAALDFREGDVVSSANALDALTQLTPEQAPLVDKFLRDAKERFDAARRSFPDTAEAHLAYAKLLIRMNQLPTCVAPLQRATQLDPENHITWNLLGSVLGALGKTDKAREAFERSLQIVPDQPRTRQALESLAAAASQPSGTTQPDGQPNP